MRMMMADMADIPAFSATLGKDMVITNGYNRPRYVNPSRGVAGFLGFAEWSNHWQKATLASTGSGSLNMDKHYAVKVVPVDTDRGYIGQLVLVGPENLASIPVTGETEYVFNIPSHPDNEILFAGVSVAQDDDEITFAEGSLPDGAYAGKTIRNIDTGETFAITSNDTDTITATGVHTNAEAGHRFHVQRPVCKQRHIYVAEMDAASDLMIAAYHFQGVVEGNGAETFTLSQFASSNVFPTAVIQPPNAAVCETASKHMFLAGGIYSDTGTAWVDIDPQVYEAGAGDSHFHFQIVDDLYAGAGQGRVMRLTFGPNHPGLDTVSRGSRVTITGANDSDNDVSSIMVLRSDPAGRWIEYQNDDGVEEYDNDATAGIVPNALHGDGTMLFEGCVGHTLSFPDEAGEYAVVAVDPATQTAWLQELYEGVHTDDAADPQAWVVLSSVCDLYMSDVNNPNTYALERLREISGNTRRLVAYTNALLIFTDTEMYLLPFENLSDGFPEHVFGNIVINAPHAIAASHTNGVLFWDGGGFSVTDGISANSITNRTCRWLMDGVNLEMVHNFRCAWNTQESRWETAFAYGDSITNNHGLAITSDYRVYGIQRLDVNALWQDIGESGRPEMRHGTTARSTGAGIVWRHSHEFHADGVDPTSGMLMEVTDYDSDTRTITATADLSIDVLPGTPVVILGTALGMVTAIIQSIVLDEGTEEYTIVLGQDFALPSITEGSTLVVGGIPFIYGPRWKDFESPQYLHHVRRTEMDIEPTVGIIMVDHYKDMDEGEAIHSEVQLFDYNMKKLVFPLRKGAMYQYGFRFRGVCLGHVKIDGFSTLFDTQV